MVEHFSSCLLFTAATSVVFAWTGLVSERAAPRFLVLSGLDDPKRTGVLGVRSGACGPFLVPNYSPWVRPSTIYPDLRTAVDVDANIPNCRQWPLLPPLHTALDCMFSSCD